ncbi:MULTISPECIES: hypothetical protein [unclassified Streptomyces]|uniref:hypothetical protein n=1 Tax=unclassified Streptomyces TaxID=2593676 RepID=UPI003669FB59
MDSRNDENPAAEVVVAVGDCAPEDARTVLDLLEHSFPAEAVASGPAEGAAATVWSATLDAAKPAERREAPVRLKGEVSVTLQGGPRAVERVHAALAGQFAVEDTGTVSGDQEKEIGLRLLP